MSGSSIDGQFINTFDHFYSDIGLKLLFKEVAFGNIGIRYNFDKPNRFSLNQNQSFSFVIGFGIRINFTGKNNTQKWFSKFSFPISKRPKSKKSHSKPEFIFSKSCSGFYRFFLRAEQSQYIVFVQLEKLPNLERKNNEL